MDRYGEIYTTYKMILDAIRKVPTATVLLNGDSPLFYKPTIPNPVEYFGFDLEKGGLSPLRRTVAVGTLRMASKIIL